nr:decapping and exoribonuclease protein-like isoform X2 [Hydra vulgaris]
MKRKSNCNHERVNENERFKIKLDENFFEKFYVAPIDKFSGYAPLYRQPIEFGHFSLDSNRCYHNNAKQLRYYKPPKSEIKLNFDLKLGYDNCILRNEDNKEGLDNLLKWLQDNKKLFSNGKEIAKNNSLNTDFVTWRGHLTKILCAPYENNEPWKMAATLFNGTIYISEVETEKAKFDRSNRSPKHQEMCYWGYKFESYLTESMQEQQDLNPVVNTNEAFCSVVRTRLNKNSIICGAEVDCCIKEDKSKSPSNYIELKTTRIMNNYRQNENFARYKLLKFWAQSFLAGIPKIVVGMRDDEGIVKEIKSFNTLSIPGICKEYSKKWDANVALNFLDGILNWLKKVVVIDNPNVVYMIEFAEPFSYVSLQVFKEGSESFLPDWYTSNAVGFGLWISYIQMIYVDTQRR